MYNKENLEPIGDRFIISIHKAADESSSGLSMENNSNVSSAPVLGTIIKIGEGAKGSFKVGEKILFRRYSLDEMKYITEEGEQTVHIIEGSEIVAVVRSSD